METNKESQSKNYFEKGVAVFIVLIAAILGYFIIKNVPAITSFFSKAIHSIISIIFGIALAYIFSPVYNYLKEFFNKLFLKSKLKIKTIYRLSKTFSTIITVLLVLLIIIGLILLIIPELIKSTNELFKNLPEYNFDKLIAYMHLEDYKETINDYYYTMIDKMNDSLKTFLQNPFEFILPSTSAVIIKTFTGMYSFFKVVLNFLIGIIAMIYALNLKETLLSQIRKLIFALFPTNVSKNIIIECKYIHKVFSGFISGKILDSVIIGVICYIGLIILRMPYALIVSIVVGVTNIIPFFGPFIGAIPSVILIALVNPIQSLYFAIFVLVLQQLDGNVIGPMILCNTTQVSPFYVLFSILLFGSLWGFIGMIVAVPLWGIIQHFLSKICLILLKKKNLPTSSTDYSKEYVDKMIE